MKGLKCISGKRPFDAYELAKEALIQHHIINEYPPGEGPINVYQCSECGCWHFTSKGEPHDLFSDSSELARIKKERQANYWERALR